MSPRLLSPAVLATLTLLAIGAWIVVRFAPGWFLAAPPAGNFVCQAEGTNPTRPARLNFEPGLVEHQNWIEFVVRPDPLPNRWALCVDGRGIGVQPSTIDGNVVRFSLSTRFANLLWLSRRLDEYAGPEHWTLYYETCTSSVGGTVNCS